jgi:uncharacterized protein
VIDANILIYSVDSGSAAHERARAWLTSRLNGDALVAIPWLSIWAFLRIVTHPRALDRPLRPAEAWDIVAAWLALEVVWSPGPTPRHGAVPGDLITRYGLRGNLLTDGQLAAIAIEHGLPIYSTDTDFARFEEIRWVNPLAVS